VFTGSSALLNLGPSCTAEPGSTGDRWCAFVADSVLVPGNLDLYVFNASRAAAGVPITCGLAGDPNCLRLTTSFDQRDEFHAAMVVGNTAVFYDVNGTAWGWRPGMAAARTLATRGSTDVFNCTPSFVGTGVACLRDAVSQPDPANLLYAELLLGKVDGPGDPPLEILETVIAANLADGNFPRFQAGFASPDGNQFAWSSRATASGPEILKIQTVGNAASRLTVATDVNTWTVSADGTRWYWLGAIDGVTGLGTLVGAAFPDGARPVAMLPDVYQHVAMPGGAVVASDGFGDLLSIANPVGAPSAATLLDTAVLLVLAVSAQDHVAYFKTYDMTSNLTDLYVRRLGAPSACTLTATATAAPSVIAFSPSGGATLWARLGNPGFDGLYTRTTDCNTAVAGRNIGGIDQASDSSVLFFDQVDAVLLTGSLRVRAVTGGNVLSTTATLIAGTVGTFAAPPPLPAPAVVYTMNAGTADDGVYLSLLGGGP
jgi:hypothetical protein